MRAESSLWLEKVGGVARVRGSWPPLSLSLWRMALGFFCYIIVIVGASCSVVCWVLGVSWFVIPISIPILNIIILFLLSFFFSQVEVSFFWCVFCKPSPNIYFWDIPPVFCIQPVFRLYQPQPVSHRVLICVLGYPAVSLYPTSYLHLHLASSTTSINFLQQIHFIPLYLTVSSCMLMLYVHTYLADSCIQLYPAVSHRIPPP